jgi:hypothetical protein
MTGASLVAHRLVLGSGAACSASTPSNRSMGFRIIIHVSVWRALTDGRQWRKQGGERPSSRGRRVNDRLAWTPQRWPTFDTNAPSRTVARTVGPGDTRRRLTLEAASCSLL